MTSKVSKCSKCQQMFSRKHILLKDNTDDITPGILLAQQ